MNKTYIHLGESWYAEANLKFRTDGLADDITIELWNGESYTDPEDYQEFRVSWYNLSRRNPSVARIELFEDQWKIIPDVMDLLKELSGIGKNPQPKDVIEVLTRMGYKDNTPRESPYTD